MKKCAFTICAKNYIGLSLILEKSLKRYNQNIDFYIFIADKMDTDFIYPPNVMQAEMISDIDSHKWIEMAFKYNLTEFCTAIKPSCFKYLMKKQYEKICYFDPDILIYDSIDYVYENLSKYSIIVTPHILDINAYCEENIVKGIRMNGLFNLGFIGIQNNETSLRMINWWENKLFDECFIDTKKGQFTDQKWADLLNIFIPQQEMLISKNIGLNIAPWNFHERKIIKDECSNKYLVELRQSPKKETEKLVFVHYSGYDYKKLISGEIIQHNIQNLPNYEDINLILTEYKNFIIENKSTLLYYMNQNYTYNYFESGEKIDILHRRIYNNLIQSESKIDNPFSREEIFYKLLKRKKMFSRKSYDVDKINRYAYNGLISKIKIANFLLKIFYKIIGYERYFLMIKFFNFYSEYETHSFLIEKKIKANYNKK